MKKYFTVKLEIAAESEKQIDKWLDQMPEEMGEACYDVQIKDHDAKHYEERIRYDEDWNGNGEHFVFEGKWSDEDDWGLDLAFTLFDYKEEKGALMSWKALSKIRDLMNLGIDFRFGK